MTPKTNEQLGTCNVKGPRHEKPHKITKSCWGFKPLPTEQAPVEAGKAVGVIVRIMRPEGYEDVCDELVAEDAMQWAQEHGWKWEMIEVKEADMSNETKPTEPAEPSVSLEDDKIRASSPAALQG